MKKAVWLFETGLFIFLSIPLALLPLRLSIKVGELLGLLFFHVWGSRRRIAIENLKNSISSHSIVISEPVEEIIRNNFKNLGKSFAEIIKIYYGFGEKIIHSVEVDGIETFHQAQAQGTGILFLTGHCGNWELLAIAASVRFSKIAGVARPINNPYLNALVERVRERYGNSVIYKQGALRKIIERLRKGKCVGILMDQAVVPNEGYVIDFLGRGAWTSKIPALIARKTGASVLPMFIHRTDRGHRMKVYPAVQLSNIDDKESAVIEDTKRFSSFIEKYIQEHPSEWLWIHRRWKRDSNSR